jgi:hypothetical protein
LGASRVRWVTTCHSGRVWVGMRGLTGKETQFAGILMLGEEEEGIGLRKEKRMRLTARDAKGISMDH